MQTSFPTRSTHLLTSIPSFLLSLLLMEMISPFCIRCTLTAIFWMPLHSHSSVYRMLFFFPVSSMFSSLLVGLSFYHLKTKHKNKSLHDPALSSTNFPNILLSSQIKFLSTMILQTTSPSNYYSLHSAPATPLKFVLPKTAMTSLFLNPMYIFF